MGILIITVTWSSGKEACHEESLLSSQSLSRVSFCSCPGILSASCHLNDSNPSDGFVAPTRTRPTRCYQVYLPKSEVNLMPQLKVFLGVLVTWRTKVISMSSTIQLQTTSPTLSPFTPLGKASTPGKLTSSLCLRHYRPSYLEPNDTDCTTRLLPRYRNKHMLPRDSIYYGVSVSWLTAMP